jgi:hypothetical protein
LPVMREYLVQIAAALDPHFALCRLIEAGDGQSPPLLAITVNETSLGRSAIDVCRDLRRGDPPIQVGHGHLHEGKLILNPLHLTPERTTELIRRLREELSQR